MRVLGFSAEHNLHIPTRELVRQDADQAQVIRIRHARPVGWSPDVEDERVNGVAAICGAETWRRRR